MKLQVDLSNREEVSAAHVLLAAVLGNAFQQAAGPAFTLTHTAVADPAATAAQVQTADPAAVFGAQSAAPLPSTPAPGSAVAGQPLTALAALPGSSLPSLALGATDLAHLPAGGVAALPGSAALSSPAPGVELDADGLPWDERIHSGSKAKNADGRWGKRRGFNDAVKLAQIQAELRATLAAGNGVVAGISAMALPDLNSAPASVAANALPGGVPGLPALGTGAAVASPDPTTFEQLMLRVSAGVTGGHVPNDGLQRVCVHVLQLPSIVGLQQRPDLVPAAWAAIRQHFPGVQ